MVVGGFRSFHVLVTTIPKTEQSEIQRVARPKVL